MKKDDKLRKYDASEERQYMLNDEYEVYEKQGAPTGALAYHYHNFYEIIYIVDGSFASQVGDTVHSLKKGDFLLIDKNNLHRYSYVEGKHDTSRRIILWITDTMIRRLADEDVDLSLCFRENGSQVYHFPIYYEELLRGFLMKLATSEILNDEA